MANFINQLKVGSNSYDFHNSELIEDTRIAPSSSITGNTVSPALYDGKQITLIVKNNITGDATLTLTLSGGSTTSPIPIYINSGVKLNSQITPPAIIRLVYESSMQIAGMSFNTPAWYGDIQDNNFVGKTTSAYKVYATNTTGATTTYNWSKESADNNTFVVRDTNGRIVCGAPTADNNAATKKYVDDSITSAITNAIGGSY